jgi:hypothetical protein
MTDPYPPRDACDYCGRTVCIGLCGRLAHHAIDEPTSTEGDA